MALLETRQGRRRGSAGHLISRQSPAGPLRSVRKFSRPRRNVDALFQVGCIGLIKAIDNSQYRPGRRFSTYGVPIS